MKHFTKQIVIAAGIVALIIGSYVAYQHYFAAHNEVKIQSTTDDNQPNFKSMRDKIKAQIDQAGGPEAVKTKFDGFKNQIGQGGKTPPSSTPPAA